MTAPNPLLRAAMVYAEIGWRVLPCQAGGKLPIVREWPNATSTDPDVITEWWRHQPNANIATATGAAPTQPPAAIAIAIAIELT